MAKNKGSTDDGISVAEPGEVEAPAADPRPKPSPTADDRGRPPPYGTPELASPKGPLPRVCKQTERANVGQARFKVACRNYTPQPIRYVLARDEAEARDCYLRATRLDDLLARLRKRGGEVEEPDLVVTALAD